MWLLKLGSSIKTRVYIFFWLDGFVRYYQYYKEELPEFDKFSLDSLFFFSFLADSFSFRRYISFHVIRVPFEIRVVTLRYTNVCYMHLYMYIHIYRIDRVVDL